MYDPSGLHCSEPAFEFARKLIGLAAPPAAETTFTFVYERVSGDTVRNAIHLPSGDQRMLSGAKDRLGIGIDL